jgi:hypothetical protein
VTVYTVDGWVPIPGRNVENISVYIQNATMTCLTSCTLDAGSENGRTCSWPLTFTYCAETRNVCSFTSMQLYTSVLYEYNTLIFLFIQSLTILALRFLTFIFLLSVVNHIISITVCKITSIFYISLIDLSVNEYLFSILMQWSLQ